jgi:hypothetical protein
LGNERLKAREVVEEKDFPCIDLVFALVELEMDP